jgi:hypothetical protein
MHPMRTRRVDTCTTRISAPDAPLEGTTSDESFPSALLGSLLCTIARIKRPKEPSA